MAGEFTTHGEGRTLGAYRIGGEIGRGGMGVVYSASRLDTGETVALKLMLPEIAANARFRERFVREASLGSGLDHPNIVPIFDAGEVEGELYIAMRLVEGRDLKSVIEEKGTLPPRRVLAIMRQVASALDSAHESGVVHHDIKPQNILISESELADKDLVYVTDFGLIRPAGSESTSSRTGTIFGSIQYMSPEQVEGMACDGRADVYALGCVLYECLTGEIPFDRPNEVAVLWAHVHEQPARVTERRPELPGGIDSVVATAMAKHPDDRFLTCGELVEELERGLERKYRPVVMPVVRPLVKRIPRMKTEREVWAPNYFPELSRVKKMSNRVNWIQVAGVTAILCLLAAALVQFAHPGGISGAVGDAAFAVGDGVLSAGKRLTEVFSEDEDGAGGTFASATQGTGRNAFRRGETRVVTKIVPQRIPVPSRKEAPSEGTTPPTDGEGVPASAVKTQRLLFVSSREGSFDIYSADAAGRDVSQLTEGKASEFDPVFSPDGTRIAFARGAYREELLDCPTGAQCPYDSHIFVMNADGTGVIELSTGPDVYDRDPTWSPDGKSIVFTRWPAESDNADLHILTEGPDGTWTQSRLTTAAGSEAEPVFSPDGTRIVYSGDVDMDTTWSEGESHMWDLFSLSTSGTIQRLTSNARAGTPSWSPDGEQITFAGRKGIFVMRSDGAEIRRLTSGGGYYTEWSTDGTKIAYTICGRLVEKCRVKSYDVRSGANRLLVDDPGDYDGMPSWGPAR